MSERAHHRSWCLHPHLQVSLLRLADLLSFFNDWHGASRALASWLGDEWRGLAIEEEEHDEDGGAESTGSSSSSMGSNSSAAAMQQRRPSPARRRWVLMLS
jgi:hypothetical protein